MHVLVVPRTYHTNIRTYIWRTSIGLLPEENLQAQPMTKAAQAEHLSLLPAPTPAPSRTTDPQSTSSTKRRVAPATDDSKDKSRGVRAAPIRTRGQLMRTPPTDRNVTTCHGHGLRDSTSRRLDRQDHP